MNRNWGARGRGGH